MAKAKTLPPTAKKFFEDGEKFIKTYLTANNTKPPTIVPGTEQWDAWREYFERHLRWMPVVMRQMVDGSLGAAKEFTVPSEFPQVFDREFVSDPNWRPALPKRMPDRYGPGRMTLEEIWARYGRDYGLNRVQDVLTEEQTRRRAEARERLRQAHEARLRASGAAETGGLLVSQELAGIIEEQNRRRGDIPPGRDD